MVVEWGVALCISGAWEHGDLQRNLSVAVHGNIYGKHDLLALNAIESCSRLFLFLSKTNRWNKTNKIRTERPTVIPS